MMRWSHTFAALIAWPALLLSGCGQAAKSTGTSSRALQGDGQPVVYTVNYPLYYFTQRIAGDAVALHFPAPSDEDPVFWKPDDETLEAFQQADLILRNGATYAKWAAKASLPESKVVDTSKAFANAYLEIKHATTHSHGPGGAHSHAGTDFNTWLDPVQAKQQAQAIHDALAKRWPVHTEIFGQNLKALLKDIDELDAGFKALKVDAPLVASHPVYNYLARRYGWKVESMVWEPEAMPSADEWAQLAELLKRHPAKLMLWEDTPTEAIASKLKADYGLDGVVLRPCGNRLDEGDYLSEMKANLVRLRESLH